ncbi:hypothetical protein CLF_113614 [Clonorchis sinensis]|uniref:Fibronectin type-III domain-containing protein n=1 Tax=Clonorchis sinensis TaxID=79923 RepID=G7YMW9_CLOSI|nr:hypothetical protein CLF_113614 [Clonorchis sinensis]
MVSGLKSVDNEARLALFGLFPLEYRRLRGDLIPIYALFEQVPSAPKLIGATTEQNVPSATVSWTYDGACTSTDFLVTVYATAESVPEPVRASGLSTSIGGLPMCVDLVFGVVGRNQFGSGRETNSSSFRIDAVPSAPKLIGATTEQNVPSATVSWTYDGACASTDFLVTVYATAESVPEPVRASGLSTSIGGLPMCVDLVFGVVGRNQFGSGRETNSSSFRIDAAHAHTHFHRHVHTEKFIPTFKFSFMFMFTFSAQLPFVHRFPHARSGGTILVS